MYFSEPVFESFKKGYHSKRFNESYLIELLKKVL